MAGIFDSAADLAARRTKEEAKDHAKNRGEGLKKWIDDQIVNGAGAMHRVTKKATLSDVVAAPGQGRPPPSALSIWTEMVGR